MKIKIKLQDRSSWNLATSTANFKQIVNSRCQRQLSGSRAKTARPLVMQMKQRCNAVAPRLYILTRRHLRELTPSISPSSLQSVKFPFPRSAILRSFDPFDPTTSPLPLKSFSSVTIGAISDNQLTINIPQHPSNLFF